MIRNSRHRLAPAPRYSCELPPRRMRGGRADCNGSGRIARLRPGAHLPMRRHVGNFVEIKNSRRRARQQGQSPHLRGRHRDRRRSSTSAPAPSPATTTVPTSTVPRSVTGRFIGSGVQLIAPVEVGAGAVVGAESGRFPTSPRPSCSPSRAPVRGPFPPGSGRSRARNEIAASSRGPSDSDVSFNHCKGCGRSCTQKPSAPLNVEYVRETM